MSDEQRSLNALILYWSATGNTEKVADVIEQRCARDGVKVTSDQISEDLEVDLYDYDLVFFGMPTYGCLPPGPVLRFIKNKMKQHAKSGDIKMGSPLVPGKYAAVFCTYSGPHTGLNEAIPVGKYAGQLFEHIGFKVMGEWYVVGEFHGKSARMNVGGRLGDIRGRPDENDLAGIDNSVKQMLAEVEGHA